MSGSLATTRWNPPACEQRWDRGAAPTLHPEKCSHLVDAADDRAVDDEPRCVEGNAAGSGDALVLGQVENIVEVGLAQIPAAGDGLRAPLREVNVPQRAV